jgi:glycosyltransferase involved in cell wall biosynthesis
MSGAPRLSIGLPVYNGAEYLAESIEALLGQTFEDFELIIVDNASTDQTADICRRYLERDARIRYFRHQRNIGLSPNHNFAFAQSRGEFFCWASSDDLYARDLYERCVAALDQHQDVVLAAGWTAAIDSRRNLTQALDYPLATDSPSAPARFRSMLFGIEADHGLIRADDDYGVIRSSVLRRVAPYNSFYHADKTMMMELALHGRFHHERAWLYFRRDHDDRALRANPTVRRWCSNLDPRRADRLRHPVIRLYSEYLWGFVRAIARAPLSFADRLACYQCLGEWALSRALRRGGGAGPADRLLIDPAADISVDALVAGGEAVAP